MAVEEILLPLHIFLVQKHLKQENDSGYFLLVMLTYMLLNI